MSQDIQDTDAEDLKKAVLKLITNSHHLVTKHEIAKVLGVKGARRRLLKHILAELKEEGYGSKLRKKEPPVNSEVTNKEKFRYKKDETEFHLGLFQRKHNGSSLVPCHRKDTFPGVFCEKDLADTLTEGDVVFYHLKGKKVHIDVRLGSITDPKVFSLMAVYAHKLPYDYNQDALDLASKGKVPPLGDRVDLRNIPLVTIDGEDARDFDDAVWAAADIDPQNVGGWRMIVAIADVSYYVRPADALDREAYLRGNSVYFPDRVVPMLPEALSNDLCSLKPHQDRACLVAEIVIDSYGKIKSHRFKRGLMRSCARLTYAQVQNAINGTLDDVTKPIYEGVIKPLYGAYKTLLKARHKRGTLDLNIPERQVKFDEKGFVKDIVPRERLDSHQLIEEMMIAANVAAAKTLLVKNWPTLFRVHDIPDAARVENLRTLLKSFKITIPKAEKLSPIQFNQILTESSASPYMRLINDLVLRSQAQARYAPQNIGHFGLSLAQYCHFTSPIRRYSDLVVHRALIEALELGEGGQESLPLEVLEMIGDHISATERIAATAEREVMDRYLASYLENQVGSSFKGSIVGVSSAGLFIGLDDNGAQGFVPKSRLPGDYYVFDTNLHRYIGSRTKKVYQLGQPVTVLLDAADPITCSISFSLTGQSMPKGRDSSKSEKSFSPRDGFERKKGVSNRDIGMHYREQALERKKKKREETKKPKTHAPKSPTP